jgi:hypothetical protein
VTPRVNESDTLLWQLGVVSSLFDMVVAGLTDADAMRPPAVGAWSVRLEGRVWRADWADDALNPGPPTTVAWLLWHVGWWWSDVIGRAFGDGGVERDDAPWPGSVQAAIERVRDCQTQWRAGIAATSDEDFASTALGDRCWPLTGLPFSRVVAWVNTELMKNTAEIGATRRILSAR